MTPTLTTPRLRLEPIALRHVPDLQRHFADWEVIRRLSTAVPWPYPPDGVRRFVVDDLEPRIAAGRAMAWALVLPDRGEAIGLLEWRCDADVDDHRGFWLGRAHQGQGLMTEAVTAFHDYIFVERDDVERIFVLNAQSNVASRRVKQKTGAELVGHADLEHHSGETRTQRWVVTRERWRALRGQLKE